MPFLHKETTWTVSRLVYVGDKSSYQVIWTVTGHLKPYSLEDTTFTVNGIAWALYKLTIKWDFEIYEGDTVEINSEKYIVKDTKNYSWITFNTIKILLTSKN